MTLFVVFHKVHVLLFLLPSFGSRQLHYFLADDTIEIRAVHGPNSGRDPIPVLVKRGKIPKSIAGGAASEAYHWRDFAIGVEVSLHTRAVFSSWYKKHTKKTTK